MRGRRLIACSRNSFGGIQDQKESSGREGVGHAAAGGDSLFSVGWAGAGGDRVDRVFFVAVSELEHRSLAASGSVSRLLTRAVL